MSRFAILLSAFILLTSPLSAETKFKVGQTYSGFIQLDNDSKNMQIPLPEGRWNVAAVNSKDPSSRGTILVQVYLYNAVNNKLKGLMKFMYAYDNQTSGWKAPHKQCGSEYNLFSEDNGIYDGTQSDCWRIRGITVTTKKSGAARDSISYMQEKGFDVPVIAPLASYYRFNRDEFYIAEYIRNPEFYGVPKPVNAGSAQTNDYAPDRINQFPKKKAFIDEFIAWGKEWKKYTDLGFEGKLTENLMGKSVHTKAAPVSETNGTGIEAKLSKLKSLVEKGLISPEDAAAKRKEILDSM
jgi:hypothetical protein